MAKRYFNWKLAIVLLMGIVVLGVTAVGLRKWQKSRRAENALPAGLEAYKQQRWEEAASNLGRYLGVNRGDVSVLLKYAEAQFNIRPSKPNRVQGAIAAYREALRIDKSNAEAAKRLAGIYLAIGSPGEAGLIVENVVKTNKDPELGRIWAVALAAQRKFAEAATQLKSLIAEHPDQILAYETLGQLAEQRPDDFPDPAAWFNQAVDKNPSSALAYVTRAGFHLRSKDTPKAIADLQQAEKLDLSDSDVRLRLAIEFINADVPNKAEEHLAAVQAAKPTSPVLWQTWAQLALQSQSQDKMAKVADTGLKELSAYPWDFMPVATELFIRAGQLDRATECIGKLRQKDILPEGTVAFFEGLIADQKGQVLEAVKLWRRAVQSGNKFPQVRLGLASALSRLGDTQSALRELRSLVSERPENFAGRIALVRLLARTGNWAQVAEQARRAAELSPGSLEAKLHDWRARLYLLAMQPTPPTAKMWQEIEKQLASLEKATEGAADVKLLQFQLAMQQDDFARAGTLLAQLKQEGSNQPAAAGQRAIVLAEAELLVAQDKPDEAIATLKQAIKNFPEAVEPVTYLAILLDRQGKREECETILSDASVRIGQPATQRDLALLLAQFYVQWNKPDKAYELVKNLAEKLPQDIPLKRRLLACEQVIKDPAKAQQLVNEIKTLEGQDGWQWRYEQARLWFAGADFKQRYTQITSLLQENLLSNPEDQASRALLAAAYDRRGELRLAISTYQEALSRSPDDLRVIIPAVAALYRAREYGQADELLKRASERRLYHPQLEALRLESHLRRGELSQASDILEDLFTNDPNNRAACLSLALLKMQQNKFDEAEPLLNKLKAQEPNSLAVASAQIKLNILRKKPQEAIRLCDEIVDNLKNASAYILRARANAELGQADKAIEDLDRATSIEPNSIEAWTAKSDFYRSAGQSDKAVDCLQQAISLAPDNIQIQKRLIPLLLGSADRGKVQQGKALLDKAFQSSPTDIDVQLFKARSWLGEGTAPAIANAEKILQQITEQQPQISEAWLLLGETSLSRGEPAKAADAAMRGLTHRRNDRALLLLKASADAARSPIFAIPTLKALYELDPNDVDIAVRLARTYIAADQAENAVKLLQKRPASSGNTLEQRRLNTALAVALYKNGNKEEAQKKLDLLVQADPNDPSPLLAQVQLFQEDQLWSQLNDTVAQWLQNHPADVNTPITIAGRLAATEDSQAKKISEDLLRHVLERSSSNLAAMTTLAMLLQTLGRQTESAELYRHVLQLNPDNVIVINNLAWILCEEQGEYQRALALAEKGLKIAPQYIDLIDTRGMIHYRLGQLEKAIADFTKCLELYLDTAPAKVASRFHLARALNRNGQPTEALKQLDQALDLHKQKQIGGLSPADLAEAQRLLEQLQKKGS